MLSKVWDVIIYPFENFNTTVEVWEWISDFIPHFIVDVIYFVLLWILVKGTQGGSHAFYVQQAV